MPAAGEEITRALFDALVEAACAVGPQGEILMVNAAWREGCISRGGSLEHCAEGASYFAVTARVPTDSPDGVDAVVVSAGLRRVLAGDTSAFEHDYRCSGPAGPQWFRVRVLAAELPGRRGALVLHTEVSDVHVLEQRLRHRSTHDELTGLPNRHGLASLVREAGLAHPGPRGVAVALVSLDRFRSVNDLLGPELGDDLLIQVGRRLVQAVRPSDVVVRYSGDEFVVVWSDLPQRGVSTSLADRLVDGIRAPFTVEGRVVHLSASIGVAFAPTLQPSDELIAAAGAAMRGAKARGGNRVLEFSDAHRLRYLSTMAMEGELWDALGRGEFVLHYQPVIDLRTARPRGVEALVRWYHPTRGLVAPDEFIPVAEGTGLIVPLGSWVLRQACADAAGFSGQGAGLHVAVNVSVHQMAEPDFADIVLSALRESGLAPDRLVLEVTESAHLQDELGVVAALNRLTGLGVRVAIDDFGTGYSSLLYLRRYPVSALKLDREFVAGIDEVEGDDAICSSIVALARSLGVASVAEGVETVEQARALGGFGCDLAQGYLWSAAVPLGDLSAALEACAMVRP